jgi:DNA-binding MarR family transcriptional regulator
MSSIEDAIKSKPIKNTYHRATLNILQTASWLQGMIAHTLKPFDISEPQFNVLRILRGQEGKAMNLYEIQDRMVQKESNVSRIIDKLVEKHFVTRKACKDNRRRVDIFITDKGMKLLTEVDPAVENVMKEIFDDMKKDKVKVLNKILDELRESQ